MPGKLTSPTLLSDLLNATSTGRRFLAGTAAARAVATARGRCDQGTRDGCGHGQKGSIGFLVVDP